MNDFLNQFTTANRLVARAEELKADASRLINEHRHYSARARTERRSGLLHIDYSGAITRPSLIELERRLLPDRRQAKACFERMDSALTMFGMVDFVDNTPRWAPPSAIIVRQDQLDEEEARNRVLARLGVIRTAWLPECANEAMGWVALMQSMRP